MASGERRQDLMLDVSGVRVSPHPYAGGGSSQPGVCPDGFQQGCCAGRGLRDGHPPGPPLSLLCRWLLSDLHKPIMYFSYMKPLRGDRYKAGPPVAMPCHLGPRLRLRHPMICSPSDLTFSESKKQVAETQIRRAGACWQLCGLQGVGHRGAP